MVSQSKSPLVIKSIDHALEALSDFFKEEVKKVDDILASTLETSVPLIAKLSLHLIQSGGKRLRPLLTLASRSLFGEVCPHSLYLATAVELIHTATLLHDDVVDHSESRRGQKTANLLWGNAASVLVGDFLFAQAFNLMVRCQDLSTLTILSQASATIAQGEVWQLTASHQLDLSVDTYFSIIGAKTAALFGAACQVGASIAHQDAEICQQLYDYGYFLGVAFQIVDDVLDYQSSSTVLGKSLGDDFKEGKVTLPLIYTLEQATPAEKEFFKTAFQNPDNFLENFSQALPLLETYQGIERALEQAHYFSPKAIEALAGYPDSSVKTLLCHLAAYAIHRHA